jgi:hypothetical protein
VKPETISCYGDKTNFICLHCDDSITTAAIASARGITSSTNGSYRISNGGIKIKSPNSSEMDYRDFVNIPTKNHTVPTKDKAVVHTIRYFEEKQKQPSVKRLPSNGHAVPTTASSHIGKNNQILTIGSLHCMSTVVQLNRTRQKINK